MGPEQWSVDVSASRRRGRGLRRRLADTSTDHCSGPIHRHERYRRKYRGCELPPVLDRHRPTTGVVASAQAICAPSWKLTLGTEYAHPTRLAGFWRQGMIT